VTCWVQLGWGPRLEDLSKAAVEFHSDHGLRSWVLNHNGQLTFREDVDSDRAVRLAWDFHVEVQNSANLWRAVPVLWPSTVVKIPAGWSLVMTATPAEPCGSYPGFIAIAAPVWRHIGSQLPFSASEESGMFVWRGPGDAPAAPPSPWMETEDDRVFAPDGDPPDFIRIEER
jgi:hypothetical protein